jgi:hypothetical protein
MSPVSATHFPQPRNLTSDGRVFFDSFDVLSPHDQAAGVENVYEYERAGQGSCDREAGCIFLMSSGRGAFDSSFFGADESGKNVFIATRERLLPEEDSDELVDLYDAREGGGFRHERAVAPCTGEGCTPQAPSSSTAFQVGSAVLSGVGNLTPSTPKPAPVCGMGRVLKQGLCVKKRCRKGRRLSRGRCIKSRRAVGVKRRGSNRGGRARS